MKIQIRNIIGDKIQITTTDERWYSKDNVTFIPSVTWICSHYPKGKEYFKWLASKGWDEAEEIKTLAGSRGSKVHRAIEDLVAGKKITMDAKYLNPDTAKEEELTVSEYECLMSFVDWANEMKPKFLLSEFTVFSDEHGYAGTGDIMALIKDEIVLIDIKTSQYIWPSHELQVSALKKAALEEKKVEKIDKLAILQLGYKLNKKHYKYTEVEDKFPLFLAAKAIWEEESSRQKPSQKDYPTSLALT